MYHGPLLHTEDSEWEDGNMNSHLHAQQPEMSQALFVVFETFLTLKADGHGLGRDRLSSREERREKRTSLGESGAHKEGEQKINEKENKKAKKKERTKREEKGDRLSPTRHPRQRILSSPLLSILSFFPPSVPFLSLSWLLIR